MTTVITHTLSSGNVLAIESRLDFGEAVIIAVLLLFLFQLGLNFLQELVYKHNV